MFELPARSLRIAQSDLEGITQNIDGLRIAVKVEWYAINLKRLVVEMEPASDKIHSLVASCLRQTKESYDQAIFAAHEAIKKPMRRAGFPWAWDQGNLEKRFKELGVDPSFRDAIRDFHPYGNAASDGIGALCRAVSEIANDGHSTGINATPILTNYSFDEFKGMGQCRIGPRIDDKRRVILAEGSFSDPIGLTLAGDLRFDHDDAEKRFPVVPSLEHFIAGSKMMNERLFAIANAH